MRRTFFLLSVMFWRRALPPGAAWWLCLVLVWMGGCASVPAPTVAMHQARIDLQTARASGAAVYDPVGLGFARNKFGQAQLAVSKGKFVKAAELAAESSADSRLAQTKALLGAVRLKIQHGIEANALKRAQNEQARMESARYQAQQRKQLSQETGSKRPSADTVNALSTQAVIQQDMPAPSAAALRPPTTPDGPGFQPVPGKQPSGRRAGSHSRAHSGDRP